MKTKLLFISAFLFFALAILAQRPLPPISNAHSFQSVSLESGNDSIRISPDPGEVKTNKGHVFIYPNPSNGNFTVSIENKRPVLHLEVYNVVGERILQQDQSNLVSIPNAQTGIYFIKIDDGTGIYTKKITVQ
jgi:hypothetical protein